MKRLLLAITALLAVSACENMKSGSTGSSSGPTQKIKIVTTPEDTSCAIDRDRMTFERVDHTPTSFTVEKTGKDLTVRCLKSGYSQASATLKARADKSYDDTVNLVLKPKSAAVKTPAKPAAKK